MAERMNPVHAEPTLDSAGRSRGVA